MVKDRKIVIYTIGHSTHTIEQFIAILKHYKITRIVDVRSIPRSRYNPQFNEEELKISLQKAHISYSHAAKLGGFRPVKPNSVNTAWKNKSFRGFADYMQTDDFNDGLQELIEYSKHDQIAIMCAETLPWRCHRSLIADALLVRGINVQHIYSLTLSKPHILTPWIKVQGTSITYPA